MVNFKELVARIKVDFGFSRQEIFNLIAAMVVTAFVFSFRDWGGDHFEAIVGIRNLLIVAIIASISFLFRIACQKIYGLSEGHKAEFQVWWPGLLIMVIVAFLSKGRIPLIMIGSIVPAFMVRHRLGEFRYGFSYWNNAMIGFWGILGNLILAIIFSIGLYFLPGNYFFSKGLWLNLIMAAVALLPLPKFDGMNIFFGSRLLYAVGWFVFVLAAVLLLTGTSIGLILSIVIALITALVYIIIGSEK